MCPFHGLALRRNRGLCGDARCTADPACRLRVYPAEEINDFVFAYCDGTGREPDWHPPTRDEEGWTKTLTHVYSLKTHPQETSENVIDLSHLSFLHGFEGVSHSGRVEINGPCFKTDFRIDGSCHFPLLRTLRTELEAEVQTWGLGLLFVETVSRALSARTLNWFLSTPC